MKAQILKCVRVKAKPYFSTGRMNEETRASGLSVLEREHGRARSKQTGAWENRGSRFALS